MAAGRGAVGAGGAVLPLLDRAAPIAGGRRGAASTVWSRDAGRPRPLQSLARQSRSRRRYAAPRRCSAQSPARSSRWRRRPLRRLAQRAIDAVLTCVAWTGALGPCHECAQKPRKQDRRPRRRHVQPCLQVRGAPGRDRAQAGAGDGGAQVLLGLAHLRAQRVPRVPVARATASGSPTTRTRSPSELAGYLLEHARRERLALLSRPVVEFETDERLGLGEFGIQTRVVQPAEASPMPTQDPGRRTVRPHDDLQHAPSGSPSRWRSALGPAPQTALLLLDGKRLVVGPAGVDARPQPAVRRDRRRPQRLAPARRDPPARRLVGADDLGSTNGSRAQRPPHRRARGAQAGRRDRARDVDDDVRAGVGRHTPMLEPVSVGLKFGFLIVLYLFLCGWPGAPCAICGAVAAAARRSPTRAAVRRRDRHVPPPPARGRRTRTDSSPGCWSSAPPGTRPGSPMTCLEALRSAAAMSRSGSRIRSRPRTTPASRRQGHVVVIEDLGSTNGTYLNE